MAKQKGMNKSEASIVAGYSSPTHSTRLETTKAYQAIEKLYYKDELLKQISLEKIAKAHIENITQTTDKGARNKAIEMALSRIEPSETSYNDDERVTVILKG